MPEHDRNSGAEFDAQTAAALAKFARSPMVRPLWGYLVTLLVGVVGAGLGYVGGKIDTKADIAELTGEVRTLNGSVAILTSKTADVQHSFDALTRTAADDRGDIPMLKDQMIGLGRHVVIARVSAFATESKSTQERKLRASGQFIRSYDNQINKYGATPAGALDSLFANVAIPEE